MSLDFLVDVLAGRGYVDPAEKDRLLEQARQQERRLTRMRAKSGGNQEVDPVEVLVSLRLPLGDGTAATLDEDEIMRAVADEVGLPFRKIDPLELDLDVVTKTLPKSFALKHLIVPVAVSGSRLEVAVCDPFNHMVLEDVRRVSDFEVSPVVSTRTDIRKIIGEFYGFKTSIAGAESQISGPAVDLGNLEQYIRLSSTAEIQSSDKHIKNAVDYLFNYAFEHRASDIHIEPKRKESSIRIRIDGVLHTVYRLPKVIHGALVSRIKTISRLDIAEKRRPQDGRIKIDHQGREAEIRVSTVPVAFGEKVVMRILDPDILFSDLSELFFHQNDLAKYKKFIAQPHGIVLVTGPTGSGKSTTLYSSLRSLADDAINITTVEDPIEMIHEQFNQIAVQPTVDVTFGTILRNILRQDPDIIMVGEMRDQETVQNAIQAALTGHLVLSTLHTNDAPSAVTRLVDIGAERFLVCSTVIGVIAQRLLRKNCPYCLEDFVMTASEAESLGLRLKGNGKIKLKRGAGCLKCRGTGYLGRVATIEVLPFSERLKQVTMSGEDSSVLKKVARSEGMSTLRENALRIMIKGDTTYQEVLRVTSED